MMDGRGLIIGIVLLLFTVVYIVMHSFKAAILTGVLSAVWLGKTFVEWWKNKKNPS